MGYADVYTSGYSATYGVAQPPLYDVYSDTYTATYGGNADAPGLQVALQLTDGTWPDVTSYVLPPAVGQPAVTIGYGRPDETSQASPATLAMTVDNRTGNWTQRNPAGIWYGQFGRNSPLRVSVPSVETFLRLEADTQSGASCPDTGALDISGAIDIRVDLNLSSYLPAVLASKWAGSGTATVTTTAGTTVGATCGQSVYSNSYANQFASGQHMDSLVQRPVCATAQKVYLSTGSGAIFPTTPRSNDASLMQNKVLIWLDYKPAPDGSDAAALHASINAYVSYAAAHGAPQPKIVLWQEPQDKSNIALGLTNAATYKTCMKNYYAGIKALAGSPVVVYDSASNQGESAVASWYPGDAYCDEVAQDLYGYSWKHGGVTLSTLQSLADGASPQKPLSHAEAGTALSQTQANAMSQQDVADYFAYSQGVFTARAQAGLPNGEWMWYNGDNTGMPTWNTIVPGDFRISLMQQLYDALQPSTVGGGGGPGRSWALTLNSDGTLTFWWSTDGTTATIHSATSTAPVPLGRVCLRVHGQVSTGGVTFYTAPGGNAGNTGTTAPWVQLGAAVGVGSLNMNSAAGTGLQVGYNPTFTADEPSYGGPTGQVYQLEVRSFAGTYSDTYSDLYGVAQGGNSVADAAFYTQPPGTASFADQQGNMWTPTGSAELSGSDYRFHGELASLPVTWDPTVHDVLSPVQAGGMLRRLSQGTQPPVSSAFKRFILGLADDFAPVAYWPGEDMAGAQQVAAAIGPAPMTGSQLPTFAGDSSFACSAALTTYAFSSVTGPVQPYTGGSAAVVRFLMHVPASPGITDDSIICRINTSGSAGDVTLKWKTHGELRFTGYGAAGGGGFLWDTGADGSFSVNGELCLVSIELTNSGSSLAWQLSVLPVGSDTPTSVNGTVASSRHGHVTAVHLGLDSTSLTGTGLGHVFVQTAYEPLTDFATALAAYVGETCATRFARLCTENGIQPRIYGPPALDVPMGAQSPDTLVNLLQLCETTGRGLVYEPRQVLGLGYRTVRSLCQQDPAATLDASLGHLDAMFPTDDDQRTVNDVTATAADGSSFRAVLNDGSAMSISPPPAGAGDYGNSYTVNPADDSQLPGIAYWLLLIGSVNEERYPAVTADLMGAELAAYLPQIQALDVGGFLDIINPPAGFLPPGDIRQLVYGYAETIGTRVWGLTWNCVPESPYEVGIYGDPVYGRMDTDGSQLDADIGTGDTQFLVDISGASGIGWTTDATQFPFDVVMGGEQMTVTAVASPGGNFLTGNDATFDSGVGDWVAGTGCTVGWASAYGHTSLGSLAMTSSGSGTMTAVSSAAGTILTLGLAVNPGDQVTCSAWFKAATAGRYCAAAIDFYDGSGNFLQTSIGTPVPDVTSSWTQATATVAAPANAAFAAADMQVATTILDSGMVHRVDDVFLADLTAAATPSQLFTVIRSVNGVVKAHSAGESVALAHPAIIALA